MLKFIAPLLILFSILSPSVEAKTSKVKEESLQDFIAAFPYEDYDLVHIPGQGSFYIDRIDDLIKNILRSGAIWEPYMLELMKLYVKPNTIALDIGAHIGTHTVTLSHLVGPNGHVYAFEPQRKIYRELVKNLEINQCLNVTSYHFALGNKKGKLQMASPSKGNEAGTPIGTGGNDIRVIPLDNLDLENVSFIKMDVEGFERNVLKGAKKTILRNRPVIVLEIQGGYDYDTAPPDIQHKILQTIEQLEKMHYRVGKIFLHDYLAVPHEQILEAL